MANHNIDDFFKKGIEGFELEPSESVWAGVENAVPAGQPRNYTALFLVLFALIFAGTSIYLLLELNTTQYELERITQQLQEREKSQLSDSNPTEGTASAKVLGVLDTGLTENEVRTDSMIPISNPRVQEGQKFKTQSTISAQLAGSNEPETDKFSPGSIASSPNTLGTANTATIQVGNLKPESESFDDFQFNPDFKSDLVSDNNTLPPIDEFNMSPIFARGASVGLLMEPHLLDRSHPDYYTSKSNTWFFGAYHIGSLNYRRIDAQSQTGTDLISDLNDVEMSSIGHGLGLSLAVELENKWRFTAGLEALSRAQEASYPVSFEEEDITNPPDPASSLALGLAESINSSYGSIQIAVGGLPEGFATSSFVDEGYQTDLITRRTMDIIRVPLSAEYLISKGRWTFGIGGGLAYNRVASDETSFTLQDLGQETVIQRNSVVGNYISLHGTLAIEWSITERLNLRVNPTYESWLSPIYSDENIRTLPFSYGLRTGLIYDLRRL